VNAGLPDGHAHDDESSPGRGRMTNPVLSCMFGFLCFLWLKSQVHPVAKLERNGGGARIKKR